MHSFHFVRICDCAPRKLCMYAFVLSAPSRFVAIQSSPIDLPVLTSMAENRYVSLLHCSRPIWFDRSCANRLAANTDCVTADAVCGLEQSVCNRRYHRPGTCGSWTGAMSQPASLMKTSRLCRGPGGRSAYEVSGHLASKI